MNKLTIQINNKEALERLIGNDTEVEIDIRNSVVQKFTEKHLKSIVNSPIITNTLESIKDDIIKQFKDQCEKEIATFQTTWDGHVRMIHLRPEIQAEISSLVRRLVDAKIQELVEQALETWRSDPELKKSIDSRFKYHTTEFINNEIRQRLDKLKANI